MQDLAEKVCNLQLSLAALAAGKSTASSNFPKFQELVTVSAEMKAKKDAWHSIVFVKERQSVHAIAGMLQDVSELANISIFTFPGRPIKYRSDGMKMREQMNALLQFKEAQGMAVLVSTAAAEEGLDIVNCELVVCYTVVETGREMIQKRGRARMAGSQFVCIAEEHEQARVEVARMAEFNARAAQVQMSDRSV